MESMIVPRFANQLGQQIRNPGNLRIILCASLVCLTSRFSCVIWFCSSDQSDGAQFPASPSIRGVRTAMFHLKVSNLERGHRFLSRWVGFD